MSDRKKRTSSFIQRIRVPVGFLFGVVFLVIAQPTLNLLVPGLIIGVCGLLTRAWAAGHLRKHQELTHPMHIRTHPEIRQQLSLPQVLCKLLK